MVLLLNGLLLKFINSLQDAKILDWSKLETFAEDRINVNEKLEVGLEMVENIAGKGENAGYQHFSPLPIMFSKGLLLKVIKGRDCVVKI